MDFKNEDFQRAAAVYDDLNATACFYTTALRILSKANWSKQVSFDNHRTLSNGCCGQGMDLCSWAAES